MWTCLGREAKVKVDVTNQVPKAIVGLIAIARGAASPQVFACGKATVTSGPRVDEGASSVLGTVIADALG